MLAFGFLSDASVNLGQKDWEDLPPEIVSHIHLIAREYREKKEGYLEAIGAMVDLLLIYLSRIGSTQSARPQELETAKNYIDNYYMTDIKVADLAKNTFYSMDHFIRMFQKEYGVGPKQYIMEKRLEESRKLLRNTDMSICDIALQVGYHSNAEFSAFIKKHTGQTPTLIRAGA